VPRCTTLLTGGGIRPFGAADADAVLAATHRMASASLRVLGSPSGPAGGEGAEEAEQAWSLPASPA